MSKPIPWWKEPTRSQWASLAAAWSGWVLDAFDFTIYLLVIGEITREFGVSVTAAVGSVTLTLLVRLLGGLVAGAAADRWGRKGPLMVAVLWFAACDVAVAFAPSFTWILIFRTLFGFGMGAEWTAGASLAMENWPERSKGIASGILQAGWPVGYLLAALASALIVPVWGWRALFILAAVPALLVLPIRMWVPESPEWQRQKARGPAVPLRALLSPEMLRRIIGGSLVMALGFGVYYGLQALYPMMLASEQGLGTTGVGTMLILFNVGMLIGTIACGVLAARRGVTTAVVVPALLMVPLLPLYIGSVDGLLPVGAFLGGAIGVGFCGVVPMMLTNLFDPAVRARCVGLVYHAGAFAGAFVPMLIAALHEQAGLSLAAAIGIVAASFEILLAAAFLASRRSAVTAGAPAAAAHL